MKKFLSTLLLTVVALSSWAYDAEVNGIYYYLNSTDNTASVTCKHYGTASYSGSLVVPSTLTYSGTTYSVTSIGRSAFCNSTGLTSITIPSSVTSIGEYAFEGCSGLTSITIPNSVTAIGYGAFDICTSLPVIDNLRYADTYLIGAIDKTLSSYTIKEGTRFIGISAFSDCTGLTSITIPNSVTLIGGYAFYNCYGLTSVTIGNSVKSIGEQAFGYCTGLREIHSNNATPPSVGTDAFYKVMTTKCTLYVPSGSKESYDAATGWKGFTNTIEEVSKCATPTISLVNGKIIFACETQGAKCHYTIKATTNDAGGDADVNAPIDLNPVTQYVIECYASADGYADSETVTTAITIDKSDVNSDGKVDVLDVNSVIGTICGH